MSTAVEVAVEAAERADVVVPAEMEPTDSSLVATMTPTTVTALQASVPQVPMPQVSDPPCTSCAKRGEKCEFVDSGACLPCRAYKVGCDRPGKSRNYTPRPGAAVSPKANLTTVASELKQTVGLRTCHTFCG